MWPIFGPAVDVSRSHGEGVRVCMRKSMVHRYLCRTLQWRSRTFGRPGRRSNLPPFRFRFFEVRSSTFLKSKFEPDAAKDPT